MRIKQHPGTGLWIREDGAVLIPAYRNNINPRLRKFHWTYGSKDKDGYLRVCFRGKLYKIHRLVAETYIPNPNGYKEVDHFPNRDRTVNFVSNLRWANRKMQMANQQRVDNSLEKYGVRYCDDHAAYHRARLAKDPGYRVKDREYAARQHALGKRVRKCPDGKKHWLTDEEFNERYGKSPPLWHGELYKEKYRIITAAIEI